jgi:hypothetical protein
VGRRARGEGWAAGGAVSRAWADEVHLEEGGVKLHVASSPLTEAKDAGDVGGATILLNEATIYKSAVASVSTLCCGDMRHESRGERSLDHGS